MLNLLMSINSNLLIFEKDINWNVDVIISDDIDKMWADKSLLMKEFNGESFEKLLFNSKKNPWDKYYSCFTINLNDISYYLSVVFIETKDNGKSWDKYSVKIIESQVFEQNINSVFNSLLKLSKLRNVETWTHLLRSSQYSKLLTQKLKKHNQYSSIISEEFILNIFRAAPLYDIWKIWISDSILNKESKLTPFEFEIMKEHSNLWANHIKDLELSKHIHTLLLNISENITRYHHEKWDGTWYPKWLKWKKIPLEARIVAVIDVFDALCSKRCYKKAFPLDEVREILLKWRWIHFDPIILDVFMDNWDSFIELKENIDNEYWE